MLAEAVMLPGEAKQAMVNHARFCHPLEACGLVATDGDGSIRFVYALTNTARSATRFVLDPNEHYRAICHSEAAGWRIGGVFHSHPEGPATPSPVDVAQAADPEWVYLVVSGDVVRGWRIPTCGPVVEIELR